MQVAKMNAVSAKASAAPRLSASPRLFGARIQTVQPLSRRVPKPTPAVEHMVSELVTLADAARPAANDIVNQNAGSIPFFGNIGFGLITLASLAGIFFLPLSGFLKKNDE